MGRSRELEGFRSICLASGLGQQNLTLLLPWKRLLRLRGQRGLATALTLIGAGTMGAVLALRYASYPSGIISFPWSGGQILSSRAKGVTSRIDELTVPGLRNMGNNCFLNVILQALASSEVLVAFVKEYSHTNGDPDNQQALSMPLAEALSDLLNELSQLGTGHRVANPRDVMYALGYYVKKFDLANQQDSAEALGHLACALQEERAKYFEVHMPNAHSFGNVLHELADTISGVPDPVSQEVVKFEHVLESWRQNLHWPMQGTLGSLLTCQQCSFQFSTDFQFFNEISLSPAQDANDNIVRGCTLEDCLKQFTTPEWIANVKCNRCTHLAAADLLTRMNLMPMLVWRTAQQHGVDEKQIEMIRECSCDDECSCEASAIGQCGVWNAVYTAASKRLLIGRVPEVLCLQIQRAAISQSGDLKKLIGHVIFPKTLDLFPYTIAAPDNVRQSSGKQGPESMMQMRKEELVMSRLFSSDEAPPSFPLGADLFQKSGVTLSRSDTTAMDDNLEHMQSSTILDTSGGSTCASSSCSPQHILPSSPPVEQGYTLSSGRLGDSLEHMFLKSENQMVLEKSANAVLPAVEVPCSSFSAMILAGEEKASGSISNFASRSKMLTVHSKQILYELLSVVVHHGGPHSGHYSVYRRARIPPQHDYLKGVFENPKKADELPEDPTTVQGEHVAASPSTCSNVVNAGAFEKSERLDRCRKIIHKEASPPGRCMSSPDVYATFSPDTLGEGHGTQVMWFKVSDSDVKRVSEDEVYLADASQLFYERVSG